MAKTVGTLPDLLKVNLLSLCSASLGIVYQQTVPKLITEEQFVEVASFSRILPGSDALQLAVFVGHKTGMEGGRGGPHPTAAILPPTVIMFIVAMIMTRVRGEQWVSGFVQGVTPALAAMMVMIAYDLLKDDIPGNWVVVVIAVVSLGAMLLKASPGDGFDCRRWRGFSSSDEYLHARKRLISPHRSAGAGPRQQPKSGPGVTGRGFGRGFARTLSIFWDWPCPPQRRWPSSPN